MNRYRVALTVLVGIFLIIAIFSSMVGVGLFKGLLILAGLALFTIICVGGMVLLGPGPFWWDYFKPSFAIPIAWGSFHLGFALLFWRTSGEIWALHWKALLVIELAALVLCLILNKRIPFEKRASRKLLVVLYVCLFVFAGVMITCRLFWGEFAANLDRATLYRLMDSQVELAVGNIEKFTKDHQARPFLEELNKLTKEGEKRLLSKAELKRTDKLKATIQKIYAVPPEKRINWKKWWSGPEVQAKQIPKPALRHLSGIFKLPADERIVSKDMDGRKLKYQRGEIIRLKQLSSPPGKFWFINRRKIPSFIVDEPVYATGRATGDAIIELKSTGKEMMVQAQIIPRRKRRR